MSLRNATQTGKRISGASYTVEGRKKKRTYEPPL